MRTIPYQYGEAVADAAESFGRIARRAPVDVPTPALARIAIDAGMVRLAPVAVRLSFELHAAARAERSRQIADLIASTLRWLNGQWQRYAERRRQRAVMRSTYRALRALDSRTLRDLGIGHGEIFAVALEVGRNAESARLDAARIANGLRLF